MVSVKSSIAIPDKYKSKGINIPDCINGLQNKVLTRACILKGIVKDISIGPDSLDLSCNDSISPVTSPPSETNGNHCEVENGTIEVSSNSSTGSKSTSTSTHTNGDISKEEMLLIKSLAKKKHKFDKDRRDYIQMIVTDKMTRMREAEQKIKAELNNLREESRLARAQIDYNREQALLQEEEDMANEAEYWRNLNKQLSSRRLIEANERVKRALEKQSEAEERHKRELKEKRMRLDKMHNNQLQYRACYQHLQEITKKCRNSKELMTAMVDETAKLKTMYVKFELLIEKCKKGEVTNKDLEEAGNIIKQTEDVLKSFDKEVENINMLIENAEKKQQEDQRANEERLREANSNGSRAVPTSAISTNVAINNTETNNGELDECVDKASYANYLKLKAFLDEYEESLQPLLKDDRMKTFRFSCKKAINTPVNAISPLSREHMQDKFSRLSRLLKGHPVTSGDIQLSASSHPLGTKYCTNLLATKFVGQGEYTVSSKPEAAFAIAGIAVSLWQEFPDFGTLLLAHFQKECPYLIPAYTPHVEGQSKKDNYRMLGYRYVDGKIESQVKFLKRMSGTMTLYSAILVTQQHPRTVPHPLGLQEGWRWLAATLNTEPRADISASLILDMLDVTGSELIRCYGTQFQKLLHLLCTDYFPRIEKVTPDGCGGPVGRLKTFLEKILKDRMIPPHAGMLQPHIW